MNPESAREILLIRSLEASDRDGIAFQPKARVQATKDAGIEPRTAEDARLSPAEETRLIGRSRSMVRNLENQSGDALRLVALAGAERGRLPLFVMSVLLGAFVLGAVSNYLGRDGVINLLAIPIFGLIAWNVVMYLIMAVSPLISRRQRGGLLTERVGEWLKKGMMTKAAVLDEPYRVSAQKFVGDWTELSAPARWRRIRMLAHACAILLAAGVLAGMYLRGIGYEYKAGWESTFLDAEGVRNWLRFLLGPGSALTGISIPPGEMTIGQLDLAKGSGEKADQWIHLFAANTALYIFVPRLLFVAWEYVGLGRWRSELGKAPLFAIYYDKLAKGVSGGDQLVHVLPFHCSPEPRQRDTIRSLIHQMWGGAAHVDFSEPAAYGEEEEMLASVDSMPGYTVLFMSLSVTPEGEAHGFLIGELQKRMRETGDESRLLVLLDESRFRERFSELPEFARRLEERRSAWDELANTFGLQIGYFNSDDSESAEQLARTGDQLVWSPNDGRA